MYMPEHISGTGDAIGLETYSLHSSSEDNRTIEAGHDQFFIPEEAVSSIYESADYMTIMDRFADQLQQDSSFEADPIRQIKNVRSQLRDINHTLDKILDDNFNRDRREQYLWAGLAGLALVTLVSLFRK